MRPAKGKIRWLYDNVDDEYANEIVRNNAEKYLGVDKLQTLRPKYVDFSRCLQSEKSEE